jgi:hypothetical protein
MISQSASVIIYDGLIRRVMSIKPRERVRCDLTGVWVAIDQQYCVVRRHRQTLPRLKTCVSYHVATTRNPIWDGQACGWNGLLSPDEVLGSDRGMLLIRR